MKVIYFSSVTNKQGVAEELTLEDLQQLIENPVIAKINSNDFAKLTTKDKLQYKDVGGYVFGESDDGLRTSQSIVSRTATTLDIDEGANVDLDEVAKLLGFKLFVHTTISSTPMSPRYRVIVPFSQAANIEEFSRTTNYLVKQVEGLGIKVDGCSVLATQIMFKPTVLQDLRYAYVGKSYNEKLVNPSSLLGSTTTVEQQVLKQIRAQQNPRAKKGYIGAFCSKYNVHEAIHELIPDVYMEGSEPNSYSYTRGTSQNGLKIYEDMFTYSYHDSDPTSHRLCHSFDLVRIHMFGQLDRRAGIDYGNPNAPSFAMMVGYCKDVLKLNPIGNWDFSFLKDDSWTSQLTITKKGILGSAANIDLIFKNDDNIKGVLGHNVFEGRESLMRSVPWREIAEPSFLKDVDYAGFRYYFDYYYGITAGGKLEDAMKLAASNNQFHPIRNYLNSVEWDGVPRVDRVLIDYMGAEDSKFNRAAFRKFLLGAINRVFNPGYKFDYVLILVGLRQGEGKSTLASLLARQWFSDSFLSFTGKESFEQLQGSWIIEIGELAGMRKAEVESIKHFITKRVDKFRPAYGRVVEEYPRQCVFFGTTNEMEFLKDTTGNRRFWPVRCNMPKATKSIWEAEFVNSVDQLWAEAMHYYRKGESTELSKELFADAAVAQRDHIDADTRLGIVESFLSIPINKEYEQASALSRVALLRKELPNSYKRTQVSAIEIWCECFERDKADINQRDSRDIAGILRLLGWMPDGVKWVNKFYGSQRTFIKSN